MVRETEENLKTALASEAQANTRYVLFAEVAKREGYHDIASHFRRVAEEETKHARALFEMLYPQISTKDVLKMALEVEARENTLYSQFAAIADKEGKNADAAELRRLLNEAKEHFEECAKTERAHAEIYRKGLELLFPGV